MPFQTDNNWPPGLLTIFKYTCNRRVDSETRSNGHADSEDSSGAFDELLNYCFGNNFVFHVAPGFIPETPSPTPRFVVYDIDIRPVFLVVVKNESWAQKAELRYRADEQIRDLYTLMLKDSPIPRLWGLSVLGTSVRIYCGEKESNQVNPRPIPRSEHSTPILPPTEWDLDLLSQEGFDKMKNLVADISKQTGKYDLHRSTYHGR